ncbi:MAG TPA: glycosyltransferase [Bacteroidota bacterium]|nr:glycosyltransferase [Bacteroidota bacterium]
MTLEATGARDTTLVAKNEGPHDKGPQAFAGRRIFMLLYLPSPNLLPPMYHEAVSLANSGAEVTVACWETDPSASATERLAEGMTLWRMHFRSLRFFQKRFGISPSNKLIAAVQYVVTYTEYVIRGASMGWRAKADLYEAHDLPTLLPMLIASGLRRRRLVYRAHELYPEMHAKVKFAFVWKVLERLLVPHADLVITPEPNRSAIYEREYHARSSPITVMNCPPYQEPIISTKLRDAVHQRGVNGETMVLYQGLFDHSRCIREMIAAASEFRPGIILVLMGGGFHEWRNPEQFIQGRTNIVALPRVTYHELAAYTASADIGLLFYRNDCRNNYFCAPNKVHEYMMMGLPMVTVNYPGIRALVEREGIGVCVDPEDPHAIAEAVNTIASEKETYRNMRANCLRSARERYNWEHEFQALKSAYGTLLNGQDDGPRSGR